MQEIHLPRQQVQADQGLEMSIISDAKAQELNLEFHSLGLIGMAGLTMQTVDNHEAPLTHWVHLTVGIVGI